VVLLEDDRICYSEGVTYARYYSAHVCGVMWVFGLSVVRIGIDLDVESGCVWEKMLCGLSLLLLRNVVPHRRPAPAPDLISPTSAFPVTSARNQPNKQTLHPSLTSSQHALSTAKIVCHGNKSHDMQMLAPTHKVPH
jgi:hypothetical protein